VKIEVEAHEAEVLARLRHAIARPSCAVKDGKSDFDQLRSGAHDAAVFLFAFDLIELDGEDLRPAAGEMLGELNPVTAREQLFKLPLALFEWSTARRSSRTHASLVSKASSRSGGTCPTTPGDAKRGSRSRTQRARLCCGYRMARGKRVGIGKTREKVTKSRSTGAGVNAKNPMNCC
jgi:hypothetical protein